MEQKKNNSTDQHRSLEEIEKLVNAVTDSDAQNPVWYDATNGTLKEKDFADYIIQTYRYKKSGKCLVDENGKPIKPEAVKKIISDELSKKISNISRRLDNLYRLLIVSAPEEAQDANIETFTAAELDVANIPDTPFVVDGLLPAGLTVLGGAPKCGKSWLSLDLGESVAKGNLFFGRKTCQGDVLYMALEDSKKRLQNRIRAIGANSPSLHFTIRSKLTLDNGLIAILEQWIVEHPETRLIILDTLQKVKGPTTYGKDQYASDYERLGKLQELAVDRKVAIFAVHHLRKKNGLFTDDVFEQLSGSTAIFGASDCAWVITGKRNDQEKTFSVTGRDITEEEYKIEFGKDNFRWIMKGTSDALFEQQQQNEYNSSPLVKTIRACVKESKGYWRIAPKKLFEEVIKRELKPPTTSERKLKSALTEIRGLLAERDGIIYTQCEGGKDGRDFIFTFIEK